MRVLIGVHHFPPGFTGGAEWAAYTTAKALLDRGYEVRVFAVEKIDAKSEKNVTFKDDLFEGVPIRRLFFDLKSAPDRRKFEYDNPWTGEQLRNLLAEYRPNLFHLISGYMLTGSVLNVCKEFKIPVVVTLTDFWFLCPRINMLKSNGKVSALPISSAACAQCLGEEKRRYCIPGKLFPGAMKRYWAAQKEEINRIDERKKYLAGVMNIPEVFISPSNFLRSMYIKSGVRPERIIFSRQGRDYPYLNETLTRKTDSKIVRFGYIGQIGSHKGVHLIIDAVKRLRDVDLKVELHGDLTQFPSYVAGLQKMVNGDERVEFAGKFVGAPQLTRIMQNLDMLIVPSICYENSPNVILESFAHKTPVLVSNFGGMAELVDEGVDGLRFEVGDAASLAEKMKMVIKNKELVKQLRAGIKPVKTVAEEITELEKIYQQVVQNGSRRND